MPSALGLVLLVGINSMNGNIIISKQSSSSKSRQLSRALHGYVDKSNYGKYEREGLLDKISYRKLINGSLILRKRDLQKFDELLEKYQAEYYIRNVEPTAEDEKILSSKRLIFLSQSLKGLKGKTFSTSPI